MKRPKYQRINSLSKWSETVVWLSYVFWWNGCWILMIIHFRTNQAFYCRQTRNLFSSPLLNRRLNFYVSHNYIRVVSGVDIELGTFTYPLQKTWLDGAYLVRVNRAGALFSLEAGGHFCCYYWGRYLNKPNLVIMVNLDGSWWRISDTYDLLL